MANATRLLPVLRRKVQASPAKSVRTLVETVSQALAPSNATRKLLLTSVVLLVNPDTVVQLWFVTTTGLVFLVLFLALSPYRDEAAGRIQLAALVQLEFTYVTAAL